MAEEPLIAVFVDYENLAIGARDSKWRHLNIDLILKRLLEKGRIVYKRAYCDWSQYRNDVRDFHARGIELVDIPRSKMSGKNSRSFYPFSSKKDDATLKMVRILFDSPIGRLFS